MQKRNDKTRIYVIQTTAMCTTLNLEISLEIGQVIHVVSPLIWQRLMEIKRRRNEENRSI